MKPILYIFLLTFFVNVALAQPNKLKVSPDGRYLIYADSKKPFFWLGDTAWELFHRLNREEADEYLENRAKKGFTVIQAVVWAELVTKGDENAYGQKPFIGDDFSKPNEAYFKHVDYIVNKAQSLGLYIALLPVWGDKFNKKWGAGPEISQPNLAYLYGQFLGNRYKTNNIIWVLGGDRNPETPIHFEFIKQLARGIREGSESGQLISYHPSGNSTSATFFHNESWLDFNMTQSGHGKKDYPNFLYMMSCYQLQPTKPTLDAEPRYEDIPVRFWEMKLPNDWTKNPTAIPDTTFKFGWFDEYDIRRAGYWSILAGACGHTYGHNSIWQMWEEKHEAVIPVKCTWKQALDKPGAIQMGLMRKFFESFAWNRMIPNQTLLITHWIDCGEYTIASGDKNKKFVAVYSSAGKEFTINTQYLDGKNLKIKWFDPRKGEFFDEKVIIKPLQQSFTPPYKGTDWALLIEAI